MTARPLAGDLPAAPPERTAFDRHLGRRAVGALEANLEIAVESEPVRVAPDRKLLGRLRHHHPGQVDRRAGADVAQRQDLVPLAQTGRRGRAAWKDVTDDRAPDRMVVDCGRPREELRALVRPAGEARIAGEARAVAGGPEVRPHERQLQHQIDEAQKEDERDAPGGQRHARDRDPVGSVRVHLRVILSRR